MFLSLEANNPIYNSSSIVKEFWFPVLKISFHFIWEKSMNFMSASFRRIDIQRHCVSGPWGPLVRHLKMQSQWNYNFLMKLLIGYFDTVKQWWIEDSSTERGRFQCIMASFCNNSWTLQHPQHTWNGLEELEDLLDPTQRK